MDSPIFGSQKSYQKSKGYQQTQSTAYYSNLPDSQWYISNKNNSHFNSSQINHDLKLLYTLLTVQKNIQTLCGKIKKYINKNKNLAFTNICNQANKFSNLYARDNSQFRKSNLSLVNNPQIRPLTVVCLSKVNLKLQKMNRVIKIVTRRNMAQAWSRMLIKFQKNNLPANINEYSSCIVNFGQTKESDLGLCSKIQAKKRFNSKKHAKQMKENSIINQTSSDVELQNQKLAFQIARDEKNFQRFAQQMNSLLAYHENKLGIESDRDTWLSDNGISHSSFQNNTKTTKGSKTNKKK